MFNKNEALGTAFEAQLSYLFCMYDKHLQW